MNHDEFGSRVIELSAECDKIMRTKNADYSSESDALQNFRRFGCTGILVRIEDKLNRIDNLMRASDIRNHESLRDSMLDLRNYAQLMLLYYDQEG